MAQEFFDGPVLGHRAMREGFLIESGSKPADIFGVVAELGHYSRMEVVVAAG
jgi:hypothetical protein